MRDATRKLLEEGADACRTRLNRLASSERIDQREFDAEFRRIFFEMANTLFQVTTHSEVTEARSAERDRLYFWPGYQSLAFQRRFTPYERYRDAQIDAGLAICSECRIASSGDNKLEERCEDCKRPSLTAAAFRELLVHHEEDTLAGIPFIPGSTHRWVVANLVKVKGVRLVALALEVGRSDNDQLSSGAGHLRVCLHDGVSTAWGPDVKQRLAIASEASPWPSPAIDAYEAAYAQRGLSTLVSMLREDLYSAWLTAVFRPALAKTDGWRAFVTAFEACEGSDPGLKSLRSRIAAVFDEHHQDAHNLRLDNFSSWYTLPLNLSIKLPNLARSEEVGSAMLFGTYRIGEGTLELIAPWIQSIFDMLRVFETAYLLKRQGRAAVTGPLVHELKHLGTALSTCMILPLNQAFEVGCEPDARARATADQYLGYVSLRASAGWVKANSGFAPFIEDVIGVGNLLVLWAMGNTTDDLPFDASAASDLNSFIDECWKVASRAVACFALLQRTTSSVVNLWKYKEWRDRIVEVFGSQKVDVRSHVAINLNCAAEEVSWLGRALIALFKNCVQHGDPLSAISVTVEYADNGSIYIHVTNPARQSVEDLSKCISHLCKIDQLTAQELAATIDSRLRDLKKIDDAFATTSLAQSSTISRSRDVVTACVEYAGGAVVDWPDQLEHGQWTVTLMVPSSGPLWRSI